MTLLEVHKLMYFMQEVEEPLQLQPAKAPYGPYAEKPAACAAGSRGPSDLGVSGWRGLLSAKQLELVPGAVTDAGGLSWLKMLAPESALIALAAW